jgi:hypothetical protein
VEHEYQKEDVMKTILGVNKRRLIFVGSLTCLLLASFSAFALPASQVSITTAVQTYNMGETGVPFLQEVSLTEPATPQAVIVTWSADYNVSGTAVIGLMVNGGACNAGFGPFVLQQPALIPGSASNTVSQTRQFVVEAIDGLLVKGTNTFHLCGAGYNAPVTLNIGFSTLSVQMSK